MIDLTAAQLDEVRAILARIVPGCEVRVFGSRVSGQAGAYSDLDLAVVGPPSDALQALRDAFSASNLPILVDVHDWSSLSNSFRAAVEANHELIHPATP